MSDESHRRIDGAVDRAPDRAVGRERETILWSRLRAAGIATGDPPARDDLPWYLAALIGASAWIAAAFLLGFFLSVFDDALTRGAVVGLAVGVPCCAAALGLLRVARGRDFVEQFAIALSLVGQVMTGIGVERWFDDAPGAAADRAVWFALGSVALAMYALGRPPMHRFLCGLIAGVAIAGLCVDIKLDTLASLAPVVVAWCAGLAWWAAADRPRFASTLPPLAWALTLVAFVLVWWVSTGARSWNEPFWRWVADLVAMPLLPACVAWLSSRQASSLAAPRRALAIALAAALALLWLRAPGIGLCMSVALIGFALHRPALLVAGCAALALYLLYYYSQLDVPLLHKSYWLFGGGAALLVARHVYLRFVREGDA